MKETTYFQAKGNNFYLTKKHIALIFFAWWLLIKIYSHIVTPFGLYVYKSIVDFGDQPILSEGPIK